MPRAEPRSLHGNPPFYDALGRRYWCPKHEKLLAWVDEIASLTTPDDVHWCDGSDAVPHFQR